MQASRARTDKLALVVLVGVAGAGALFAVASATSGNNSSNELLASGGDEEIVTSTAEPDDIATDPAVGPTDPTTSVGSVGDSADGPIALIEGLAPPPLDPRVNASVVWTGEEMILWGGESFIGRLKFSDGARYDPDTGTWRVMADSPLVGRSDLRAVWTGTEVLFLSGLVESGVPAVDAAAYDPRLDSWRMIQPPPITTDDDLVKLVELVWSDDGLIVWDVGADSTFRYRPEDDAWTELGPTGIGRQEQAALHQIRGETIALGSHPRGRLEVSTFGDGGWQVGPPLVRQGSQPMAIDSGISGQKLIVWDQPTGLTHEWDSSAGGWLELDTMIALVECAGPAAPVQTDDTVIAFGCDDGGQILDPMSQKWLPFTTSGDARRGETAVWVGSAVLSVGIGESPSEWIASRISIPIG